MVLNFVVEVFIYVLECMKFKFCEFHGLSDEHSEISWITEATK